MIQSILFQNTLIAQGTRGWGFPILLRNPAPENYTLWTVLTVIGNLIYIALSLAVVMSLIYIIIGGYKYALSGGNPESQVESKKTLMWAIIGLIICLSAVAILRFVWSHLLGEQLPN